MVASTPEQPELKVCASAPSHKKDPLLATPQWRIWSDCVTESVSKPQSRNSGEQKLAFACITWWCSTARCCLLG